MTENTLRGLAPLHDTSQSDCSSIEDVERVLTLTVEEGEVIHRRIT
jgi:hypothetical protein